MAIAWYSTIGIFVKDKLHNRFCKESEVASPGWTDRLIEVLNPLNIIKNTPFLVLIISFNRNTFQIHTAAFNSSPCSPLQILSSGQFMKAPASEP